MESDEGDLDLLFGRFSARDPQALEEFPRLAAPRLKKLARKLGRGLPVDIREEIVQEMLCRISTSQNGPAFNPQRGSVWNFLWGELLNAAHRVRASYCPPGARTRRASKRNGSENLLAPESFNENIHRKPGAEVLAPEFRVVEASFDLAILLHGAPHLLIAAVTSRHQEGERIKDVAKRLGVSRFWITRESNAFFARRRKVVARASRRVFSA